MQLLNTSPCGRLVPTIEGQWAFVPDPLPDELAMSSRLISLLDNASRAVGTLAGVGEIVPNPHLLIRPLLRREAVLSSRIEGTVASLSDVFAYEAAGQGRSKGDTREVVNYVTALEYGIDRLGSLPISYRLANELHERLMAEVRGQRQAAWLAPTGNRSEARDARLTDPGSRVYTASACVHAEPTP